MNISSTLKNEIFRPLVALVVPGFITLTPYLFVTIAYYPDLKIFLEKSPYPSTGILFIIALAIGLILEDIGSRIECYWDSLINRPIEHSTSCPDNSSKTCPIKSLKNIEDNWDNYLKLELKDEIIGQRYLKTILTRVKFELSMGPALFISAIGFLWLNSKTEIMTPYSCFAIFSLIILLGIYIIYESYEGANVLKRTRQTIIEGVKERDKKTSRTLPIPGADS